MIIYGPNSYQPQPTPGTRINIINPAGGEVFYGNDLVIIRWEVTGGEAENVAIDYSIDGGYSWMLIDKVTGTQYNWVVKQPNSNNARIRIRKDTPSGSPAGVSGIFRVEDSITYPRTDFIKNMDYLFSSLKRSQMLQGDQVFSQVISYDASWSQKTLVPEGLQITVQGVSYELEAVVRAVISGGIQTKVNNMNYNLSFVKV